MLDSQTAISGVAPLEALVTNANLSAIYKLLRLVVSVRNHAACLTFLSVRAGRQCPGRDRLQRIQAAAAPRPPHQIGGRADYKRIVKRISTRLPLRHSPVVIEQYT